MEYSSACLFKKVSARSRVASMIIPFSKGEEPSISRVGFDEERGLELDGLSMVLLGVSGVIC